MRMRSALMSANTKRLQQVRSRVRAQSTVQLKEPPKSCARLCIQADTCDQTQQQVF